MLSMMKLVGLVLIGLIGCVADKDPKQAFTTIYEKRIWGEAGDGSGTGSEELATIDLREVLKKFILKHDVRKMVDAPCGSFHWMPLLLRNLKHKHNLTVNYTGYDVVQSVIEADKKAHAKNPAWQFHIADLTKVELPAEIDLILCRDALQHLSQSQVWQVLRVFQRANPRFLLIGAYLNQSNRNIETGDFDFINMMIAPFNLQPKSIYCEENTDQDKHLFLYTQAQIQAWDLSNK
jgi:Methyltransferase domain